MAINASRLYGMDIFSDGGRYLGKVYDVILDVEKGEIVRLTLESIHAVSRDEAQRIIKEKTILYKNVRSVEDVIVVTKGGGPSGEYSYSPPTAKEEPEAQFGFLK